MNCLSRTPPPCLGKQIRAHSKPEHSCLERLCEPNTSTPRLKKSCTCSCRAADQAGLQPIQIQLTAAPRACVDCDAPAHRLPKDHYTARRCRTPHTKTCYILRGVQRLHTSWFSPALVQGVGTRKVSKDARAVAVAVAVLQAVDVAVLQAVAVAV